MIRGRSVALRANVDVAPTGVPVMRLVVRLVNASRGRYGRGAGADFVPAPRAGSTDSCGRACACIDAHRAADC
jgi:hypothetical protein